MVYAVRQKRKESALKQFGYFTFYRVLQAISDIAAARWIFEL